MQETTVFPRFRRPGCSYGQRTAAQRHWTAGCGRRTRYVGHSVPGRLPGTEWPT